MTGVAPPPPPPPIAWQPPGTPTGGAPPSADTPPAAAHTPRKRWIAVLVGVLALIAVVGIVGTVLFGTRTWPPLSATYQFTGDLQDGDTSAAFSQVCDRLRTSSARTGFNGFARSIESADNIDVNILGVDRNGDAATVEFTASYDNERSRTTTLKLVYEDGDWRPCGTQR